LQYNSPLRLIIPLLHNTTIFYPKVTSLTRFSEIAAKYTIDVYHFRKFRRELSARIK